jgi:hypothetical protein
LADALTTRLGWSFPGIGWPRAAALPGRKHSPLPGSRGAPPSLKSAESPRSVFTAEPTFQGEGAPPPDPLPSGPPPDAASGEARRRARFARAKKGS